MAKEPKDYKAMVDYEYLAAMDITAIQAPKCAYQFFLSHPDLEGKMCYYPTKGTLVYETGYHQVEGTYKTSDIDEVVKIIMSKITK